MIKAIINTFISLLMLGATWWMVHDVLLATNPSPLGQGSDVDIKDYRGELDTLRQAK